MTLLLKFQTKTALFFYKILFFAKSTGDATYEITRDTLTGGAAAVAFASPPSVVGLSLGGLLLRSYDSFNKTFFLNEAFQPLETAISLVRDEKLKAIKNECIEKSDGTTVPYQKCSISKSISMIKDYGDACSLRSGLNKLQSLIHKSKESAEVESLRIEKGKLVAEKNDLDSKVKLLNEKLSVVEKISTIDKTVTDLKVKQSGQGDKILGIDTSLTDLKTQQLKQDETLKQILETVKKQ